ncbi:hypothetical protein FPOAC2_06721 [Fusarium poae]|jgi:hypothetical protein|uniref:Uncharacterized protein n=1 Tax=Fusarium poae TaxID=36050 RepID=A0A1B8AYF1_FUSPO|nr:hypothetical protein FPOAC1_006589 [Fusarium poae]KAG8673278.1 hypothetical protein FPOAC1_006589 [Fusarium poae]OBS25474.1 hypothetical protein FPOA_06008 [Fusarium poae]
MAPPTENDNQKVRRRSTRSNFGKPYHHDDFVYGDEATRVVPRHKRRMPKTIDLAVDDDDEDEDEDELASSSVPPAPRKNSIVLDCINVQLPPNMYPRTAVDQRAGQPDDDAMDLDNFLNLDLLDDEETAEKGPSPQTAPKPTSAVDLDVAMVDLNDGFANIMQLHGQQSDEKILNDRLASQRRYANDNDSPDALCARAMKPSAYSDVSEER